MKDDKSKLIKIMNELVRFFLRNGIKKVDCSLEVTDKLGIVSVSGCCLASLPDEVSELEDIFNAPRKDETEEYYWNLMGSNDFSELHLLGSLVDSGKITFEDNIIRIEVIRKI